MYSLSFTGFLRNNTVFSVLLPATLSKLVTTLTSVLLYYHATLESHDLFFHPEPKQNSKKPHNWNIKATKRKALSKHLPQHPLHTYIPWSVLCEISASSSMNKQRPSILIPCYAKSCSKIFFICGIFCFTLQIYHFTILYCLKKSMKEREYI